MSEEPRSFGSLTNPSRASISGPGRPRQILRHLRSSLGRLHQRLTSTRRRRVLFRTGISIATAFIVLLATVVGYSLYRFGQILRIPGNQVIASSGPTENILLIGSTDRCQATGIYQFNKQCLAGVNGINSDVVLVAHIDPSTGAVSLLSIPRDTFVPNARSGGLYNKIDAALYNGPNQLTAAIEQDFGIPINHFVELNFETFSNVVNAIGGLHLYFPNRLVDMSSGLYVHHTGCIYFNGAEALELVRSRHLYWFTKGQTPNVAAIQAAVNNATYFTSSSGGQYDGTGDLGRITRVHLFLSALAKTLIAKGYGNPLTDNALIGAIAPDLTVDSTFSDTAILRLALSLRHVNVNAITELTMPIVNDAVPYSYKGYGYGDVVFPTQPQDQQTVDRFLGTTNPGAALAPASISVSVIDGTNSPTNTHAIENNLHHLGYPLRPTNASLYVGPVSETSVIYAKGHLAQAERVMSSLAGTVVMAEGRPTAGATISVVTGSDLRVVAGGHHATLSSTIVGMQSIQTAASHDATAASVASAPQRITMGSRATGTTTPANPNLGAPTSANPPVASYDPHTCQTTTAKG